MFGNNLSVILISSIMLWDMLFMRWKLHLETVTITLDNSNEFRHEVNGLHRPTMTRKYIEKSGRQFETADVTKYSTWNV